MSDQQCSKTNNRISLLPKSRSTGAVFDGNLTSAEAQQVRTQPLNFRDMDDADAYAAAATMEFMNKEDPNLEKGSFVEYVRSRKKQLNTVAASTTDEGGTQKKQQILEELHVST